MKNLSELAGEKLLIYQPSIWKSYYELRYGDKVLGTIRHPNFFSTGVLFKMGNKEWELYRPHFWKSEVAIRQAGYELPYATYFKERFKQRGTIRFYKGDQLIISYKIIGRGYNIQTLSGDNLVSFKDRISLKDKTEIKIEQKSEQLEKYPWVIVLAWFLAIQRKRAAHAS